MDWTSIFFSLLECPLHRDLGGINIGNVEHLAPSKIHRTGVGGTTKRQLCIALIPMDRQHFLHTSIQMGRPHMTTVHATGRILPKRVTHRITA